MYIYVRNDVHDTEVRVRAEAGLPHVASKSQARKLRKQLCGREGCDCGVVAGPQGHRVIPVEDDGRATWRIDWWEEGEGPYAEAEDALREVGKERRLTFTTPEVGEILGLSAQQVRNLKIEPADTYSNCYGTECALYRRRQVLELFYAPEVAEARKRRRGSEYWAARSEWRTGVRGRRWWTLLTICSG